MTAVRADPITLWQGEDKTLRVTVVDGNGAAVDLAGASVAFGMDTLPLDGTPALEKAGTVADAGLGVVEVALGSADTAALAAGLYGWELGVIDGSGNRSTVAWGEVRVRSSIT